MTQTTTYTNETETQMPTSPKRLARIAGVLYLLAVGGACYLVDLFAQFLVPDFGKEIHSFIWIPSALAEISMVVYLLVIGVRIQKPDERISATLRDPVAVDPSTH